MLSGMSEKEVEVDRSVLFIINIAVKGYAINYSLNILRRIDWLEEQW